MAYTLPPKGMRLPAFPTETRPETDKVPWGQIQLGDYLVSQDPCRESGLRAIKQLLLWVDSELKKLFRGF
jgi:hypothetical protein